MEKLSAVDDTVVPVPPVAVAEAVVEKTAVLRVEVWALVDLKPHPRNPRVHPEPGSRKWEALRTSIAHDYFDPIVVNVRNGLLVSGHFRTKVMRSLEFTHAHVVVVDYDEKTHYARMIAANQLLGEWEEDILQALTREIDAAGLAAGLAGLDEKAFAGLLDGPEVEDDVEVVNHLVSQS